MHSSQNEGVQPPRGQPPESPICARVGALMALVFATIGMMGIAAVIFANFAQYPTAEWPLIIAAMMLPTAVCVGTIVTGIATRRGSLVGYYGLMVLTALNVVRPLWMPQGLVRWVAVLALVLLAVPYSEYKVFAHNKKVFSLPAAENAPAPPASSAT